MRDNECMSLSRRAFFVAGLAGAVAFVAAGRAHADKRGERQEALRRAVEAGEVRPLADIIADVRGKLPGDIVGVKAEDHDAHWIYEFRVADKQGRLFDVYVDAKSGDITRVKEK
jgi:uncharacterized membrane protein YkoI